ncbi:hypothetical protein Poli38472_004557 [Pythium oligandrum]|uniref:THO complex subunit 2 n=1 Tax=Pythium oligandrum TaxID=41045 RepID=A0A8K1FI86_PYTOL|nr:hypothetical protein Poli38472_004557 [Pythium oligandrum]|eukprot:TMW59488.1 hypothetical protein Poli38472_004557 [Pythium oligandrum]
MEAPVINEALLHQWADQGSSTVRAALEQALAKPAPRDQTLYRLLYDLIWVVLQAKLTRQDVLTVLKDVDLAKSATGCDVLTDLLWVIGNEVEAKEKGRERHTSSEWQALTRFVKDLADEEIVPELSIKSSLEVDLLHAAELMPEPTLMSRKLIRANTKTYYTQVKFNLLREESEGFAKVLSLLHTGISKGQLAASKTDLMSLIGYFDLDPNRVLDLVLDAYEMQPQNDAYAELLELFKRESIPHVLGFKFQFYKRDASEGLKTPHSLYRLAATLVEKKTLDVESLMPHLAPSKDETVKKALEKIKQQEQAAKAFGKVNLAAKTDDSEAKDKTPAVDDDEVHNQVYGLIIGMLEIGAKERAFEMIRWFTARGVDPLAHAPLTKQMCSFVHSLVASLYEQASLSKMQFCVPVATAGKSGRIASLDTVKKQRSNGYVQPLDPSDDSWFDQLFSVLSVLGANLHNDSFLFTKVLRIVSRYIEQTEKSNLDEALARVKPLIVKCLLPALSLQSCNPSTAFQLWELIKLFPFDARYGMYQEWQTAYTSNPAMQLVDAQCVQHTRRIMRRLTADRAKPSARSLTHIAHSNPLVVFRTMLRQIQSYDNLIQPVVESFKFITPLGMDVLSFVLVGELSKSRKSMKSDGTNISLWLSSLANFSGSFYRKYPNVELTGLLQYLIHRLQSWESVDLVVLSELLSKMGSCISFEDISTSQLEALAGGPHLWHEPSDPKLTNRRAIPRLRDALVKRDLALPLCLLICQVRSKMEFQEDSPLTHLKALGRMYDTCQMTLSQLLQFLNGVVDPTVYSKMLPSVQELVQEYHILPELAMTICRPGIRAADGVFKKVPRSIHATTGSNGTAAAADGSTPTWEMYSTALLEDLGRALEAANGGKDAFEGMTREMYVTFWSLILYDIHVPFPQYESEISRLRNAMSTGAAASQANGGMSSSERKKHKEKTTQMIDKLLTEQKDQVAHRKRVYERLEEKKAAFFKGEALKKQSAVTELLQQCIIPRALLSPEDALFCAKFMERIHHLNTPFFSTVQYYNRVALELPSIVLCVTEREAGNFGIFLKETFTLLHRWYQSSVTYEEEAMHGKAGFSIDLTDPSKILAHRQYKSMYAKWHRSMVTLYLTTLASEEYMSIRNSLIVLTKVIDVFPSGKAAAECLLEIVEKLTHEEREDIKIMARRYFALLQKRKSTLVEDKLLASGLNPPKKVVKEAPTKSADREDREDSSARDNGVNSEKKSETREGGKEREKDSRRRDDRRAPSTSREDLETGEVPAEQKESKKERANGSSSSGSRLKRRDSDRPSADDRANDERRDRRAANARDNAPAKTSSRPEGSSRGRSSTAETEATPKRETSREPQRRSRSRSAEGRRPAPRERERDRERETNNGKESKDAAPAKREGSQDTSRPADQESENRKRQRVESTEAALRRQLTEKKAQDMRKTESSEPKSATTVTVSATATTPTGGSETPSTPRKIVSLVSNSRKRDHETTDKESSNGNERNGGDEASQPDAKRRRDNSGGNKERGGDRGEGGQNKRNQDERKNKQHNHHRHQQQQKQQKSEGGNDNRQQQREQNRGRGDQRGNVQNRNNNNNNDGNNNRGNNAQNNNERRRDGHNNDRRNNNRR